MPFAGPLNLTPQELKDDLGFTDENIAALKKKQPDRNPSWKEGNPFVVYVRDYEEARNTKIRWGDF